METKPITPINGLPGLEEILSQNPGWLDEAIKSDEAAKILGITRNALAIRRTRGEGPTPIMLGDRVVRYTRRDCYEFIASKRIGVPQ